MAAKRNIKGKVQARYLEFRQPSLPLTEVTDAGKIDFSYKQRYADGFKGFARDLLDAKNPTRIAVTPAIYMDTGPQLKQDMEKALADAMGELTTKGVSFAGKTALITGAGVGSIGGEVARCLLLGGCHVVVTTSRASRARWEMYRDIYQKYGGKDAKLTVVPYNGASQQVLGALLCQHTHPHIRTRYDNDDHFPETTYSFFLFCYN